MGPVYRAVCLFTPQRWSQYQIILLGDRGTCVNDLPKVVTWQCSGAESNLRLWVTSGLQVRHVTIRLPSHTSSAAITVITVATKRRVVTDPVVGSRLWLSMCLVIWLPWIVDELQSLSIQSATANAKKNPFLWKGWKGTHKKPISELLSITCHMGWHNVTCHPKIQKFCPGSRCRSTSSPKFYH